MTKKDDKRQLRNLKRAVKRAGNKHRRHAFKQQLRDNPAEAHLAQEDFGSNSSQTWNGLDRPADSGS